MDPEAFAEACAQAGPMVGEVVRDSVNYGITVHTTLDPKEQPFLDDHRGDRVTALLPGVMGIEGMVEVARLLAPEWSLAAVEDVDFLAPLKFYRDEPRTIEITALVRPDGDGPAGRVPDRGRAPAARIRRPDPDDALHRPGPAHAGRHPTASTRTRPCGRAPRSRRTTSTRCTSTARPTR